MVHATSNGPFGDAEGDGNFRVAESVDLFEHQHLAVRRGYRPEPASDRSGELVALDLIGPDRVDPRMVPDHLFGEAFAPAMRARAKPVEAPVAQDCPEPGPEAAPLAISSVRTTPTATPGIPL